MSPDARRQFEHDVAALEAMRATDHWRAVEGLLGKHVEWARCELGAAEGDLVDVVRRAVERGVEPEAARAVAERLAIAERYQWVLGGCATSGAEGLASMYSVRMLQTAQAWALAACADVDPASAARARALADEVATDPNGTGDRFVEHLAELRTRLVGKARA
ncbi:MAG: hypothetical protein M3Y87_32920 [Myxococcota bacterium]|nr:hypothetical protein [Myxococcota bacterium]